MRTKVVVNAADARMWAVERGFAGLYGGVVRPEGVEPPTYWFVASCSIQLSYGRTLHGCNKDRIPKMRGEGNREARGGWCARKIRTSDPLVRSQMLYPAELRARGCAVASFLLLT